MCPINIIKPVLPNAKSNQNKKYMKDYLVDQPKDGYLLLKLSLSDIQQNQDQDSEWSSVFYLFLFSFILSYISLCCWKNHDQQLPGYLDFIVSFADSSTLCLMQQHDPMVCDGVLFFFLKSCFFFYHDHKADVTQHKAPILFQLSQENSPRSTVA